MGTEFSTKYTHANVAQETAQYEPELFLRLHDKMAKLLPLNRLATALIVRLSCLRSRKRVLWLTISPPPMEKGWSMLSSHLRENGSTRNSSSIAQELVWMSLNKEQVQAILALVQASTSSTGYIRIVGAMQTNEFLGELCNAKTTLNKHACQ